MATRYSPERKHNIDTVAELRMGRQIRTLCLAAMSLASQAGHARRPLAWRPHPTATQDLPTGAHGTRNPGSESNTFPQLLSGARSIRLTIDGPDDIIPVNWRSGQENDPALDQNKHSSKLAVAYDATAGLLALDHQWP